MSDCKSIKGNIKSIEQKIRISTEFAFIDLINELGYRDKKPWDDSESGGLTNLMKLAEKHTERIIEIIENYPSKI